MTTFLDRLFGRPSAPPERKAVPGGAWLTSLNSGPTLSSLHDTWNRKAQAYLRAYRVGWFYKGGSRIARDFSNLPWTLAYEDSQGDNEQDIVAAPGNVPFNQLDPLEQFLRLSERPNPYQSGRNFKQQQMIRLDFTGRAVIYVETTGGLPTGLYGISPERMWPSRNKQGELIGWVLDPDNPSGGTPFDAQDIIAVEYPGINEDPQGVVEAVYQHAQLSPMIPQHIADVLATGGRLAGMMWPKERSLSEDEFVDAQRAYRNVVSDPNAARRLLLMPEPMEYNQGSATPAEIGLPELSALSRDEILTAFPIHPYMVGVPLATGMNSGESLRYVRAEFWEGTMHPRIEVWEDALQQALIPRYEQAIGRPLDFDIDEPDLDDAPTLIEKVGAFRGLVAVGFDPKEAVAAAGLDDIKWNGLPDLLDPAKQAEMAQQAADAQQQGGGMTVTANDTNRRDASATTQQVAGKAITRDDVLDQQAPALRKALAAFLVEQRQRVIDRIEATFPPTKAERMKANPEWWDAAAEDAALFDRMRTVYLSVGGTALQVVADNTNRIIGGKAVDRVLEDLLQRSGLRISDINETTRKTIAATLDEGVKRGYSISQLVNGVADEAYGGVQGALTANGINVWDTYRAELIARTETMTAYNQAALLGYKDVQVRQVTAIDGDKDDECASRNGRTFSVDEALDTTDHPNGTLDWVPLTN